MSLLLLFRASKVRKGGTTFLQRQARHKKELLKQSDEEFLQLMSLAILIITE